jgi:hypothetical protein
MDPSLDRKTLSVRLADLMEAALHRGEWDGNLPGHRTLMAHYSVSAKTCLAAIGLLESRKLIAPGEHGRRREVLVKRSASVKALKRLLILDGYGNQSGEDMLQFQAYRAAWEESGGSVEFMKFDFPRYQKPSALLREAISSHQADALLMHVPPFAWTKAASDLLPVFVAGGEWRGTPITGAGYNITQEITRAAGKLRGLGHERILVPIDLIGRAMEAAVREGLAEGLGLNADSPQVKQFCPVFPEAVPSAYQSYWKKQFTEVRPTAVILQTDYEVFSLYGFCAQHGISIPRDVSVICMESAEHLEWCVPVPTRMKLPYRSAANFFKKWIRGGCRPMGMKFLPLECQEGESIAPPR